MDSSGDDIDVVVGQAQAGDASAMSELLRVVQPMVMRRCQRLLPHRSDAEEAAQDALVNIATKLDSYDIARGNFLGWATVVASNSARSTYRSLKRRSREQSSETAPEHIDPMRTSVIAGSRIDVLEALEALEESHPVVVEAFVLRDIGTLSYAEIAALMDIPLGTVKARIHEARAFMRARLIDQLG
jgi:RNA polymerase sigma factor (sigma-70 family)